MKHCYKNVQRNFLTAGSAENGKLAGGPDKGVTLLHATFTDGNEGWRIPHDVSVDSFIDVFHFSRNAPKR